MKDYKLIGILTLGVMAIAIAAVLALSPASALHEFDTAGVHQADCDAEGEEKVETFSALEVVTTDVQTAASGGISPAAARLFCENLATKRCGILGVVWVHGKYNAGNSTVTCTYSCGRHL